MLRGRSLVIEEISDFSLETQARLVQMIDNPGEYSPRFIATIQGSMMDAVDNGMIRKDLFYRLGGVTIELPSLREWWEHIFASFKAVLFWIDADSL